MWRRSWRSSISATVMLVFFLAAPAASVPAAKSGEGVDPSVRLARSVLNRKVYQTEMPRKKGEKPPIVLLALGRYAVWGLYTLSALSLLLIAWWLVHEFGDRATRLGSGSRTAELREGESGSSPATRLADVERWVQLGNYREAVHALLLIAIRRLIEPLAARPGPSRTSRELLYQLPLGPGRREAFAALVREVEVSVFGGQVVDSERYAACRGSFDALFADHQT